MAKPDLIELPGSEPIPILYEDRSVLAIDKPHGKCLLKLGKTCMVFL
jgi:23S rRNA-/tRNA-specific pseudouridylate synthase